MKIIDLEEDDVRKWCSRLMGQMGMSLSDFNSIGVDQAECAYEGYLKGLEVQANVISLAITHSKNHPYELISMDKAKGYSKGSAKEREEVFNSLGIKWGEF